MTIALLLGAFISAFVLVLIAPEVLMAWLVVGAGAGAILLALTKAGIALEQRL